MFPRSLLVLFFLSACSCEPDPMMGECERDSECSVGMVCVDNMCSSAADAATPDGGPGTDATACAMEDRCGAMCCGADEECVDGFQCLPVCETTRCGDNGILCCDAGDICLDGVVCAAACGDDEALCGASFDMCCPAGDVCIADACTTPGIECANDFDCRDPSLYCEPTIGRCLPTGSGDTCEVRPEFDEIAVTEEWHFEGVMVGGTLYNQAIYSPSVGDVSGDGIPDVVIPVYAGSGWSTPVIVGLSGNDGALLFTIDRSANAPDAEGIALANFDPSDDALEFVYRLNGGGVRMMDGDGVTELGRRGGTDARGTIEVADFNHDGTPDIVVGCRVYDGRDISDSAMDIFNVAGCAASGWQSPVVADLDGDGELEVTNGAVAYNHDGTVLWNSGAAGLAAIADLDADGTPEVILVGAGAVFVKSGATGEMLIGPGGAWHDGTFNIPGGGTGGSPTVADFDGDGLPEISTAGRGNYVVYDPDCFDVPMRAGGDDCATTDFIRWQTPTQDISSSVTGSSVFDFQGDGIAEVVYNDECFLHVYDGRDGTELLMEPLPNSSRTAFEYPIVVDVDADGNSEIVVAANNDQAVGRDNCDTAYAAAFGVAVADLPAEYARGTSGVFVYGDAFDRWVPTRPIWNQYSYHVSNISGFGEVPAMEMDNWTTPGLNNYRQNVQGEGIFNAPNLRAELEAAGMCSAAAIRLSAIVRNDGTRGVPAGITVEFWRTDVTPEVLVDTAITMTPLLPGGTERVTVSAMDIPTDVDLMFEVRIDPAMAPELGDAVECIEDDNSAVAMDNCPGLL